MTRLGEFFARRSVNRANISRITGIRNNRLNELSNNVNSKLLASELYLIARAIEVNPGELLDFVCQDLNKD